MSSEERDLRREAADPAPELSDDAFPAADSASGPFRVRWRLTRDDPKSGARERTVPAPHEIYDEAIKLKDAGNLAGAVEKLREVLAIDPNHVETHSALAVYLQRLGQPDEAIAHARKVVEIAPNDTFSYTQLSVIYMRCGKILEAEDAKARAHMMSGHKH